MWEDGAGPSGDEALTGDCVEWPAIIDAPATGAPPAGPGKKLPAAGPLKAKPSSAIGAGTREARLRREEQARIAAENARNAKCAAFPHV